MESRQSEQSLRIKSLMNEAGYIPTTKISNTLQGCIWRAIQQSTNKRVVIKTANQYLHSNGFAIRNGQKYKVDENILMEISILKYLSKDTKCPNSIVKYIDAFKSDSEYYLVMEDGEFNLLKFVVKIHQLITKGHLDIDEWHKLIKIIFKQMIECIEYIHNKNVCHFDISLENFLINNIEVCCDENGKLKFRVDDKHGVQVKLCDFGLSELFPNKSEYGTNFQSNKFCGKINYKSPEITNKSPNGFSAKSNDIWCLGTCLFMMVIGTAPWHTTSKTDVSFIHIINGNIMYVLFQWNKLEYVDKEIIKLFHSFFQYEEKRIDIEKLKKCEWLN